MAFLAIVLTLVLFPSAIGSVFGWVMDMTIDVLDGS